MARVPDMFEEFKSNSENEGFNLDIDPVAMSQESFYPSSSPHHKQSWIRFGKFEKSQKLTFQEGMTGTDVQRKKKKKSQLSMSHPILFNSVSNPGKDVIEGLSVSFTSDSQQPYRFMHFRANQILVDINMRTLIKVHNYLKAVHVQGLQNKDRFDIGNYTTLSPAQNNRIAVTLRLSDTNLYVTAKEEEKPIQLEEIPETPEYIAASQSSILFYMTVIGNLSTFSSVARPELFLATHSVDNQLAVMARGLPFLTSFRVEDA